APAPDADPVGIDVRLRAKPAGRGDLIRRLVPTEVEVSLLLEPGAPRAGAAIVDARDEVAVCRQHLVPQVARATPAVGHRLGARPAVHGHQLGIAMRRIEALRLDDP